MHRTARGAVFYIRPTKASSGHVGMRHATSETVQRRQCSLGFQKPENRAETAIEAHHETIQLHLFFPSMSTVSLASLHDCIFMVHQFTTCGVHPTIAFCLLPFWQRTLVAPSATKGPWGPPKGLKGGKKMICFSHEHEIICSEKMFIWICIIGQGQIDTNHSNQCGSG